MTSKSTRYRVSRSSGNLVLISDGDEGSLQRVIYVEVGSQLCFPELSEELQGLCKFTSTDIAVLEGGVGGRGLQVRAPSGACAPLALFEGSCVLIKTRMIHHHQNLSAARAH